jgi:enoyl-CoA hydratase/carnithine racemase
MEMLGGCDIRVACPEAKFAVMEPKRGLFAGGGTTVRLPRQIPWAQAMEFLLCADLIPAERAFEMGLLNAIVPRDALLDAAREYARRMIANAPLAVQATKQSALQGLYFDEDLTRQLRAAVRELRQAVAEGADAEAVAAAPPPSFSGGGKWEAMHEDMAGLYEVRVQGGGANHRLFCLLERNANDLGGPSLICLDGLSKPVRSAASPRDYRRVRQYAAEFRRRRTVYVQPGPLS